MTQFELLWQYQLLDAEVDRMERAIKRNPKRVALKKNHAFLLEQQNIAKKMEKDIEETIDRIEVIHLAIERIDSQVSALATRMEENPESLKTAKDLNQNAQKLLKTLEEYEQELKRLEKEASEYDRSEKEIRSKYAKVKAEYDALKAGYEEEHAVEMNKLEQERKRVKENTAGIEPDLLAQYMAIKKHVSPPMAMLVGDQCGGCNMCLPQVTLRAIRSGTKIIECETCGRMLVQR